MWFFRYRGSNTSTLPPAERAARRAASKARAYAKQRAIADEASSASTPIHRLRELLARHPARVLANPAWQLASVTDPSLVSSLSGGALEVLAGQPGLDAETLMMMAQELVRRHASHGTDCPGASYALAMRGDAPVEVLRALAKGRDPDRMGNPGFEVAHHRVKWFEAGDASLTRGWRDALPAMMADAAGGVGASHRRWSFHLPHLERMLAHDPARSAHPFILGLVLRAEPEPRNLALHCVRRTGHDRHERWLWSHAIGAEAKTTESEYPGRLSYRWKACISLWERDFGSFGVSRRCAPRGFAEAQCTHLTTRYVDQWADAWRRDEANGRLRIAAAPKRPAWESCIELDGVTTFDASSGSHLVELALVCEDTVILGRRSRDHRWWVRAAVAMNPALGEGCRTRLRQDHHWIVRAMAASA
ncbi:MAG: hypothetical protein RI990_422 [Planctomycetota bacterium]